MDKPLAADPHERLKQRKKQEVMNRVLAASIVTQFLDSGYDPGQVIEFAGEVLNNITQQKWGPRDEVESAGPVREIAYAEEASGVSGRPILRGRRVRLAPLAPRHRPQLEAWRDRPHLQGTYSQVLLARLLRKSRHPAPDRYDWILEEAADRPVGLMSLFHVDLAVGKAEIAKMIGEPEALGAGYAHEATCLLLVYAFRTLGLRRVYLQTNGFNLHNIRLNEKIGFRFEGILRASEILDREVVDVVLMSMLEHEFDRMYRVVGPPPAGA